MSEENVTRLRRAYEAWNRGDLDAALADVAPDVVYISTGIPGVPEVARGREDYKEVVSWLFGVFNDPCLETREFVDAGDKVLGAFTLSGRGQQSGVEASMTFWQVWTVRDGKFVDGQGFSSRDEALKAAGLPE